MRYEDRVDFSLEAGRWKMEGGRWKVEDKEDKEQSVGQFVLEG